MGIADVLFDADQAIRKYLDHSDRGVFHYDAGDRAALDALLRHMDRVRRALDSPSPTGSSSEEHVDLSKIVARLVARLPFEARSLTEATGDVASWPEELKLLLDEFSKARGFRRNLFAHVRERIDAALPSERRRDVEELLAYSESLRLGSMDAAFEVAREITERRCDMTAWDAPKRDEK